MHMIADCKRRVFQDKPQCWCSLSPAVESPYEESPVYTHALAVVSKAAYKTLKRGRSSLLGEPPLVSHSLTMSIHPQS